MTDMKGLASGLKPAPHNRKSFIPEGAVTPIMTKVLIFGLLAAVLSPAATLVEGVSTINGPFGGVPYHGHVRIQNGIIISQLDQGGAVSSAGPLGVGVTSAMTTSTGPNGSVTTSSADLATATLRAQVFNFGGIPQGAQGIAQAIFLDTLTFNNTTAGILELGVLLEITGTVSDSVSSHILSDMQLANTALSPHMVRYRDSFLLGEIINYNYNNLNLFFSSNRGFVDPNRWDTIATGGANALIATSILFEPGISIMTVGARLSVDCRFGTDCHYGDSSGFSFGILPTGLSYTSESGVFLTGGPVVVPEPLSLALTGAGLLLLGCSRKLRARQRSF